MAGVCQRIAWIMACTLWLPSQAFGGGLVVDQQSASAAGRGGAFIAGADDASANWFNPANLSWLEESQLQFGLTAVSIGGDMQLRSSDADFLLTEERQFEAEGNLVAPVHFYFAGRISDRLAWGIGLNSPFGLVTEWDEVPVSLASRDASLGTLLVNPNLAFRFDDRWSASVGLDYIYADVQDFSADIAGGVEPAGPNFIIAGERNLTGTGGDWGWNLALSYRGDGLRAGLVYRSELLPTLDGELGFSESLKPPFADRPIQAELRFPAKVGGGVEWAATDDWTIEVDAVWVGWSTFDALVIDVEDEIPSLVTDFRLRQDWTDTMTYRVGATWRQDSRHEWRVGAFWDEKAIPSDTLRPSLPDSDRFALSVGYGYTGKHWKVDLFYMPVLFTDNDARGAAAEGVIDGTYSSTVHLAGITLTWLP